MNNYKGILDVADGMYVQDVYRTKMASKTFNSVEDYVYSMAFK